MNNYLNQNVAGNQQTGGAFYGEAQLPAQNNFPLAGQAVQGQQHQQKTLQQSVQDNQQAAILKTSSRLNEITPEMKKTYESLFNSYGVDAANNWLKQQIINNHVNLQADNDAVIREIQAKHAEVYSIPAVQQAINAFIQMDLDPSISLREQGFHDAMEHIAAIYRSGYEAGMSLKTQNDSAKARMSSAVNSAVPNYQSNKVFSRSEIKSMSPDDFVRNEKAIFEQLGRGLIK
ncbi:MAG TPA: hypothetical protein DDW90_00800 [Cyanobacteria bacterium UBA9971]|nr:hypothetical protein [Cyanobacteria bacterium UBA9971]